VKLACYRELAYYSLFLNTEDCRALKTFVERGSLSSPCHIHMAVLVRETAYKEKARDPTQEQQTQRNAPAEKHL